PIAPAQRAAAKAASAAKARSAMMPGFSLQQIQELLREAGYRAEMEKDNSGDYIRSGAHGLNIFISTYDCLQDNTECRTLRIETGTFKPDPAVSLEALNEWSRDVATGWAVPIIASDGSYFLLMKISTTGGVTDEWLMNNLAIFTDAMSKYHKLLFPS
ncbi:MAG TPA: YbjN domain-containing protein, partial [Propylenella sp.]|nr:YbjN domain-containing protein [Propylenella sp.]